MIDLSTWLTKPDAAARLAVCERTLDRMCDRGEGPERRNRPRKGLKPEVVYNPADIDRLAAIPPHVMPPQNTSVATRPPAPSADVLTLVLDRIAGAVENRLSTPLPSPVPLYLTLPQASAYTGLSMAFLRRLIRDGNLPALRDRSLKVRRLDLDTVNLLPESSE
jgi:excisionase family DNA binding protein